MAHQTPPVKIKYITLPSRTIYNYCGAWSYLPDGRVDNRYPNKAFFDKKDWSNFYERIEKSILNSGFDDPIIIYAGWNRRWKNHPDEIQDLGLENLLTCTNTGGSRLWVAQKYNMDIPCMVNDFVDRFPDAPELKTLEEIELLHTKKKPMAIHLRDDGVFIQPNVDKDNEWRKQ